MQEEWDAAPRPGELPPPTLSPRWQGHRYPRRAARRLSASGPLDAWGKRDYRGAMR
jgi:hypothetical protein